MARRKPKYHLLQTTCHRCGTALWTGNRPLWPGCEALKARFGRICDSCLTEAERQEMVYEMGQQVTAALAGGR